MNYVTPYPRQAAEAGDQLEIRRYDLGELLAILRRQKNFIIGVALLFVGLALIYVVFAQRQYSAQTTIIIDPRRLQIFRQDSSLTADPVLDSAAIESQIEMLKSDRVILAVVKSLKLTEDDEFVGPSTNPINIAIQSLTSIFGRDAPGSEEVLRMRAVAALRDRFEAKRIGLSFAIGISFTSRVPAKASLIANEIAEAYITDQLASRYELTSRAGTWLRGRLNDLRNEANAAERRLQEFKAENKIFESSGKLEVEQKLQEATTKLGVAQVDTAVKKAQLEQIRNAVSSGNPEAVTAEALNDPVVALQRNLYLEKSKEIAGLTAKLGANHLVTQRAIEERRNLQTNLLTTLRSIETLKAGEFEAARTSEASLKQEIEFLQAEFSRTRQMQIQLKDLESAAVSFRALFDTMNQRYLLAVQQQSFPVSDARVITDATPPLRPSWPKSPLILAAALVFGIGLGGLIALIREILDNRIRNVRQLRDATKSEFLGILPVETAREPFDLPILEEQIGRAAQLDQTARLFKITKTNAAFWRVLRTPFSVFAETIRKITVSIDVERMSRDVRVIAMVSANSGEGKSTTTANLGLSIARSGKRVLMIDGDLRNPLLTRSLTPDAQEGLLEVLSGKTNFAEVVWQDELTSLSFLPTVLLSQPKDTGRYLGSAAMQRLLERLGQHYDYVIIDTAPVGPVVDVRAFAHLIDGFVLVAAWGQTARADVAAVAEANFIQKKLLGSVLTKVNMRSFQNFDTYDHSYFTEERRA
ncbi:MAG: polysaccharide biosynthesis tyrosine autokinase [Methylobacterium sp.]|nr:polysaccharide biosynthesis tyrosine autokinase [Methylobacterium sp.]